MTTQERTTRGTQTLEQAGGVAPISAPEQTSERTVSESLRRMIESVRPDAIFGSPVDREGVTVIPCAEITTGFGMGGGSGYGPAPAPTGSATESATESAVPGNVVSSGGSGAGGGGGAQGRPVAVIVISGGKVRALPVIDATKFLIAALTTLGFSAFWLTQMFARTQAPRRQGFSAARFARAMGMNRR